MAVVGVLDIVDEWWLVSDEIDESAAMSYQPLGLSCRTLIPVANPARARPLLPSLYLLHSSLTLVSSVFRKGYETTLPMNATGGCSSR